MGTGAAVPGCGRRAFQPGVARIHLFQAASNSVAFRFGKLYDKRNHPRLLVYLYEHSERVAYPWAVVMTVGGEESSAVI